MERVEGIWKFIENGLGVSYLPYSMVKDEIFHSRLIEIKSEKVTAPTSGTYVLTKVETNEVKNFVRFLKKTLQ